MRNFLVLIFILSVFYAKSQELKFGIKGGLNVASLSVDIENLEKKPLLGFNVGGLMNIPIAGRFNLQSELLLSTQGGILEQSTNYNNGDESFTDIARQTIKLTNINLPILFQYELFDGLNIGIGAQIGYAVRAKSKLEYIDGESSSGNESVEYDMLKETEFEFLGMTLKTKKGINQFEAGLLFGTSYTFSNGLFFQGRYNLGLTKVINDVTYLETGNIEKASFKNSVIQVSVGYKF